MTQDKTYPKLCKDCWHSRLKKNESHGRNLCLHPLIAGIDPVGLADSNEEYEYGASCREEREKIAWFAKCGRKGKLFEMKREVAQRELNHKARMTIDCLADLGSANPRTNKKEVQKVIELRWLAQSDSPEKEQLQYRTVKNYLEMGLHLPIWTEWEDVPTVVHFIQDGGVSQDIWKVEDENTPVITGTSSMSKIMKSSYANNTGYP